MSYESDNFSQANKQFARTVLHPLLFDSCEVAFPGSSFHWDQLLALDPSKSNH